MIRNLWLDDLRTPPQDYETWAKSSTEAIALLIWMQTSGETLERISFDHDLGGEDTSRRVVIWMIENDFYPESATVHSANPVGREWLLGMINRYFP